MFAKLEMKLDQKEGMTSQMSSSMHGALMELLLEEYAQRLHESRLHPYTQHLELRNGDWYWVVTALNEEASEKILEKTEKLHLPFHADNISPESYVEQLVWSQLGDYIRKLLRKERT